MAHTSVFHGNHEIVEIEEEDLNPREGYRRNNNSKWEFRREEKDRGSLASSAGHVNTLEDDLNQLFEIFNRRTSHGSSHPNQAGTSKRNASKKPIKADASHSPNHGISERMNLKQALRGLCLSQASEMAAIKRSMKSPRSSEAGRILTMYRNVVVEESISDHSVDDGRAGRLEISLVPEEISFDSFQSGPEKLPASNLWPSNQSSRAGKAVGPSTLQNDRSLESNDSGILKFKHEKLAHSTSSFSHRVDDMSDMSHNNMTHNVVVMTSTETGNRASASEIINKQKHILLPPSSSLTANNSIQEVAMNSVRGNEKPSFSLDFASHTTLTESPQTGKHASLTSSSRSSYGKNSSDFARKMSPQKKEIAAALDVAENSNLEVDMLHQEESVHCQRCSADYRDKTLEHTESSMTENENISSSYQFTSPSSSIESLQNEKHASIHSSLASNGKTTLAIARKKTEQKEMISMSQVVGNPNKVDLSQKKESSPIRYPRRSDLGDKALDHRANGPASSKLVSKEAAATSTKLEVRESGKAVLKDSSMTASTGSPKGKRVGKSTRNAQLFVRPLIKTKNFVKRKSKKKIATVNSSKNIRSEFNNDLYSSPHPIVCPNCQCVVADTWKEANKESSLSHQNLPGSPQESPVSQQGSPAFYQDSPISPFASLSGEVSSGNAFSDVSTPGLSSDGIHMPKTDLIESSGNSKSKDKAEFTQSSKGSRGERSSSTSGSEESNLSRPSVCDRPHMSKDARWEAIRHVKFQHGTLGLRHFNLLRKLGCGDIGTVYLAELVGTNCLFAIKVMDNEFLARRKKIVRAQTEKEILRMLDHPFLPTLYCQFTSDNLSCLVMEYCPGGDLHVLRQRQPGRCFTEQAARFYVAEVLLALEYLHMLGVVYRDLKPENILVREDGHIMLSDFDLSLRCAVSPTLLVSSSMSESTRRRSTRNVSREARPSGDSRCAQPLCIGPSCQVTCFTPRLLASSSKMRKMKSDLAAEMRPLLQLVAEPTTARSNSFVGTHEYLAPEIIKGDGHGSAVDWWTFGIFLYELLYGKTPFKGAGNEETLANVVLQSLKFPDSPLVSLQARDLISALLNKEPENRLGTERGAAEIKQHPFFDGLNWALIRCALPPELPESRSFGLSKTASHDKNNKYTEYGSGFGSGSAEHLEFEVF